MAKYSDNFKRDWNFYITNVSKLSFWGGDEIFTPTYAEDGLSAMEFFYKLDSQGMKSVANVGCREPELVVAVLRFKKALNFHIKMWAEGYDDCRQGVHVYMETFTNPPDWVPTALRSQLYRIHMANKISKAKR